MKALPIPIVLAEIVESASLCLFVSPTASSPSLDVWMKKFLSSAVLFKMPDRAEVISSALELTPLTVKPRLASLAKLAK